LQLVADLWDFLCGGRQLENGKIEGKGAGDSLRGAVMREHRRMQNEYKCG